MADTQTNTTVKASVFEDLFSDPERRLALYKVLHPEDTEATVDDVQEITLTHIFLRGRYNDLAMMAGKRLMILLEAQSLWTENIIPRCIMYLADTWNRYGAEHRFNWYGTKKVELPEAELYVVYTGKGMIEKEEITLSEEFFDGSKTAVDATVKVLKYDGGNDILDQYIIFCKALDEQRRLYPKDAPRAISEAIRLSMENGVLTEYLRNRGSEVVNIMLTLFTEEQARKMEIASEREDAMEQGIKQGMNEVILRLLKKGMSDKDVMDMTDISEADLQTIKKMTVATV